jgi:protocatechuate 3,4-dioxygenase beta subunit
MLGSIPDTDAQKRLIARLDMERSRPFDCLAYRFDLVLRGPRQTYFENE